MTGFLAGLAFCISLLALYNAVSANLRAKIQGQEIDELQKDQREMRATVSRLAEGE